MNLVLPQAKLWIQQIPPFTNNKQVFKDNYFKAMFEHIEKCGRVCYKSEDKVGEKDPKIFVDRLIASNHTSVLEHGTIYLILPVYDVKAVCAKQFYELNPYSKVQYYAGDNNAYVTTNYRVIIENKRQEDLEFLSICTPHHTKRTTMCLTTDRGVSHEVVRHRNFSYSMESTRYCNYSKDKFDNNVTYIIPEWVPNYLEGTYTLSDFNSFKVLKKEDENKRSKIDNFFNILFYTEDYYFYLLSLGSTPQEARQVLPNALKTTLVMTGFATDWEHFFDLRLKGLTGQPHPDMKVLANLIYNQFNYEKE